jgi:hypothetical protein
MVPQKMGPLKREKAFSYMGHGPPKWGPKIVQTFSLISLKLWRILAWARKANIVLGRRALGSTEMSSKHVVPDLFETYSCKSLVPGDPNVFKNN